MCRKSTTGKAFSPAAYLAELNHYSAGSMSPPLLLVVLLPAHLAFTHLPPRGEAEMLVTMSEMKVAMDMWLKTITSGKKFYMRVGAYGHQHPVNLRAPRNLFYPRLPGLR